MTLNEELKGFCSLQPLKIVDDFDQFSLPILNELPELTDVPLSRRLGKRSEFYFEKVLELSEAFDILDSNIQIINGKETIGEIDFIAKDNLYNQMVHIELVTKVYLFVPEKGDDIKHQLVGPNLQDSYYLKSEKLKNKQLPLLNQDLVRRLLSKSGISKVNKQEVAFLANVYLPFKYEGTTPFNPECVNGIFVKKSELEELLVEDDEFYLPAKKYWFCNPEVNRDWINLSEFRQQLESYFEEKRSPLCWLKRNNQYSSFFVVWW